MLSKFVKMEPLFLSCFRRKKGFSLLELSITILIVGLALAGLLSAFVYSQRLALQARHKTIATSHLQAVIEDIFKTAQEQNLATVVSTDWTAWASNNGLNTLPQEAVYANYVNVNADPLDTTAEVTWQDIGNRQESVSSRFLATQR